MNDRELAAFDAAVLRAYHRGLADARASRDVRTKSAPAWAEAREYLPGAVVSYGGRRYRARVRLFGWSPIESAAAWERLP